MVAATSSAFAQKPPTAGEEEEARTRFEEGVKLGEAGKHEAARLKFNQAWLLLRSNPNVLYNLARSELMAGHPLEALAHFRQYMKWSESKDPRFTPVQIERTKEYLATLQKQICEIEIEAPVGARLAIDAHDVEGSPATGEPVPVLPGRHVVTANGDGRERSVTVDCPGGLIMKAKLVDDGPKAPSARTEPALPKVDRSGERDAATSGSSDFWTSGRVVGTAVGGVGVATAAAGLVFFLMSQSSEDEVSQIRSELPQTPTHGACTDPANRGTCDRLASAADTQESQQNVATGLFVGGGALVLGGALLFLLSPPKSGRTAIVVLPTATTQGGGVGVGGQF
jgi:hypothetical protein